MLLRLLRLSSILFALSLFGDAHIFVYHRFGDPRYPSTNTSLQELHREFTYLKNKGYKVIPLQKLVDAVRFKKPIDNRWVVLTIDDGFKSFLQALPLFQKYHYPFTIFIATKPIEGKYPDFLTWSDLQKIQEFGTIGFHSHAHSHLVDLSKKEIIADTNKGLALFKKHLGFFPHFYAYPYGEYNKKVQNIIKSFGFFAICNQNIGAINQNSDIYDLDRIALVGKSNIKRALTIKRLDAIWYEPQSYPKDGILRNIKIAITPKYKKAWIYVTDYGWKRVDVDNGLVTFHPNYKLTKRRVRVIIKVKNSTINTKILVKRRSDGVTRGI